MGRSVPPVAALGLGHCSQIADANVVMQFDGDDFVRRGPAAALRHQNPVRLQRRMRPGRPKAPRKMVSLGSLMPARAPRRCARAGHWWRPPAGRPPPRSAAVVAPQPLP
jgi:hypothetical protein